MSTSRKPSRQRPSEPLTSLTHVQTPQWMMHGCGLATSLALAVVSPSTCPSLYRHLYDLFDPFSVTLYIPKSSKRLYDIQCELYKAVNAGLTGLDVMRPLSISQGTKSSTLPLPLPPQRSHSSSSNGGYQPLLHRPSPVRECTDYYIVMSPKRGVHSEHDSDVSGESTVSDNLSYLEQHNRNVEDRLTRTVEELQSVRAEMAKLQTFTEHLRKVCESLQAQIRIMGAEGGEGTGGRPLNGIDRRGPALIPPGQPVCSIHDIQCML